MAAENPKRTHSISITYAIGRRPIHGMHGSLERIFELPVLWFALGWVMRSIPVTQNGYVIPEFTPMLFSPLMPIHSPHALRVGRLRSALMYGWRVCFFPGAEF